MTARDFHQITPESAERLLDGHGGPEPLARLLDAAAAPGRTHEFRGEDTAAAAFEIHYARQAASGRRRRGRLPAARILALAALLCGGGGVALAAATGSLGGSPAPRPSASQVSPGASAVFPARPHATGGPVRARGPVSSVPVRPGSSPVAPGTAALCRDLAARAGETQSALERGLAAPSVPGVLAGQARYAPLVTTAGGLAVVPDYCALVLALPALPDPADLARIPPAVLSELLEGLPSRTLSAVLDTVPPQSLTAALGKLPAAEISRIQAELPPGQSIRVVPKQAPASGPGLPSATVPAAPPASPLPTKLPVG